jgi:hypothetical protein
MVREALATGVEDRMYLTLVVASQDKAQAVTGDVAIAEEGNRGPSKLR